MWTVIDSLRLPKLIGKASQFSYGETIIIFKLELR